MSTGQYAKVNGINLYYEIHGTGRPIVALHGGLGSGEMFAQVMPQLTAHHQVIAATQLEKDLTLLKTAGEKAATAEAKAMREANRETDEDVVLEVMDFLTGWCSPHMRLPAGRAAESKHE